MINKKNIFDEGVFKDCNLREMSVIIRDTLNAKSVVIIVENPENAEFGIQMGGVGVEENKTPSLLRYCIKILEEPTDDKTP